jgi:glycine/D-amino acid oxidase-like deaminating enzyme
MVRSFHMKTSESESTADFKADEFQVETLIIGAGVVGSSVAMHLAQLGMRDIRVIDFDLEGSLSSSELNAGGVRATWVEPINIEMSKLSIEYFAANAEEVGYRPCGYLWLHKPENLERALKARETQLKMGWPVEVWDIPTLQSHAPFIDKTEGIGAALFSPRDGLVNPNLVKNHFRARARALGVSFDDRTMLRAVELTPDGTSKLKLMTERFESVMSHETRLAVLSLQGQIEGRKRVTYRAQRVVNCAGPWAGHVAGLLGYSSPVHAVRRQVTIFDSRDVDLTPYGMIVDTSGVYFHPEATNGLAGFAAPEAPGINYNYDGESFFEEMIWPALYERSTQFERLKHLTGWAGLYEVSPDECAVIGAAHGGNVGKSGHVFEAHSFSGHGLMHSYAAGRALAEKMVKGRSEIVDIEPLSAGRFETGRLIHENLII